MEDFPLISRDVSWLHFNERVLQEAQNPETPLFERIKFLAIYSANLDEFYRVRVASLRSFKKLRKATRKSLSVKPKKELKEIRRLVEAQQHAFGQTFRSKILTEMEAQGIDLLKAEDYSDEHRREARLLFFEKVFPLLRMQELSPASPPAFLKNRGLYFLIVSELGDRHFLLNIPSDQLPRFHEIGSAEDRFEVTFLDDIIRVNLAEYTDMPLRGAYSIKVSRDAEMYIEDEYDGDLVAKIRQGLAERDVGLPTRFLYDARMPKESLSLVKGLLGLKKDDIIPGARYHNFNDFFGFPEPANLKGLHYPPMPPLIHPQLGKTKHIFDIIAGSDQVLHFPYHSFEPVLKLLEEAVSDPEVHTIKITLYRVAGNSAVVGQLLEAARKGKEVMVFVEAKARFDEETNLYWGTALHEAGARVQYSYPDIKVHTKLLLIGRAEGDIDRWYAYLGTGNFNEKTARVYADHALLTADPRLTREVEEVFALLEGRIKRPRCAHLFVSPFNLRQAFTDLLDAEIDRAKRGEKAWAILKMNSLEDPDMIAKLYEASQAGVSIQLIVRGICRLEAGLQGISDHIRAISIVDRFLEHARVYIFGNGGQERMYLASADWMTRNLDRRVEVAFPIYDPEVFAEIRHIIDLQCRDHTKARVLDYTHSNSYAEGDGGSIRAQFDTYAWLSKARLPKTAKSP